MLDNHSDKGENKSPFIIAFMACGFSGFIIGIIIGGIAGWSMC
jgi:hypothetical protein